MKNKSGRYFYKYIASISRRVRDAAPYGLHQSTLLFHIEIANVRKPWYNEQ